MGTDEPIILTLQLDAVTQSLFDRHREAFFPEQLNFIPAHLTLFHNLPGREAAAVMGIVGEAASRPPFEVAVTGLMPLGRGVAYALESETLKSLRNSLAARFSGWLVAQDRGGFRPHVTVQNKVSPGEAKRTLDLLKRDFVPFSATAEGFQLWCYKGGPWAPLGAVAFDAGAR